MYYNDITKQITKFPFRIKTKEEFEDEYGEYWWLDYEDVIDYDGSMNNLYGVTFTYSDDKDKIQNDFIENERLECWEFIRWDYNETYDIIPEMLKENIIYKPLYNTTLYNEPRKLVYEGFKLQDNKVYVVICDNEYDFIKTQEYLFSKGCLWTTNGKKILDFIKNFHIIFDNHKKMIRIPIATIKREPENSDNYIILNGISDLRKIFNVDYNTPRQLVYENLKSEKYDAIVVKCNSYEEFLEIQKFVFSKGYKWIYDTKCNLLEVKDTDIIILKKGNTISRLTKKQDDININYIKRTYKSHLILNGLSELKILYSPDYNSPRQLVYENNSQTYYYNNIEKKQTIYPYRFKTEREFIKEFGERWWKIVIWNDDNQMDYLFGKDFNGKSDKEFIDSRDGRDFFELRYRSGYGSRPSLDDWSVNKIMLIKNDDKMYINYNKSKELVYETKLLKFNNF